MDRLQWLFRAWRYRLRLEQQEIRLMRSLLGPGDTVLDVGAHKGGYTWWMQRAVGPMGQVYAFEPQPALARRLQRLTVAMDHVHVEHLGLSSAPGTLHLQVPGPGTSPSATFEPRPGDNGTSIPVSVTTLDAWSTQQGLRTVRLIKCDAEGHELEVFRGGETLLRAHRPALLFECERRHRASGRVDDVFHWLESLGYRGQALSSRGPIPLDAFDVERDQASPDQDGYINNFLFQAEPG